MAPDIASLESLTIAELRQAWKHHFGEAHPALRSPELFRRELAWRLDARVQGDIDAKLRQRLEKLGRQTSSTKARSPDASALRVGSTLVREWDGASYTVVVLEKGFLFEGETFASLSRIAERITGAHWSGPRFFGLAGRSQ